jgi:hypothetical protein
MFEDYAKVYISALVCVIGVAIAEMHRLENQKPKAKSQKPKAKSRKPKTKNQKPKAKNPSVLFPYLWFHTILLNNDKS